MAVINNIYLNAAYTAACEAALEGRALPSLAGEITAIKTAAAAFAAEVDAAVNGGALDALVTTGGSNTQLAISTNTIAANEQWRAGLLHGVCRAALAGRDIKGLVAANFAADAAKIATIWANLVAALVTP